ncbi:MAG: hypothetical protein PVH87_21985 [Desulfobacteraceae bacterium]|jgi:hypothetical protein
MQTTQSILDAYKAADEEQRLSMFLTYRDLRVQFTEMDMAELTHLESARSKKSLGATRSKWPRWLSAYCWGWLKHCR